MLSKIFSSKRWFFLSSSLLQAGLFNHKVIYGTRGKIVQSWISLLWPNSVLLLFSMRLIGCIEVTLLLRNAHKGQSWSTATPCRIFVGFGAGPEEYMWERFKNASPILSIRLDQTNPSTFGSIYRPNIIDLWRKVWCEAEIAFEVIMNTSIEPVQALRADYITQATTRLAQYAFFFQWWKGLNKDLKDIVFITPDIPAYACIDAGFPSVQFWQHGLLRKSLLFPPFKSLLLLTNAEVKYYKKLMPECDIVLDKSTLKVVNHNRTILFTSIYDTSDFKKITYIALLNGLCEWALQKKMQIVIRKHPCETDSFWENNFSRIKILSQKESIENTMLRVKPMLMITWFSTTLIDALRYNVVPVSINSMNECVVQDLIINLREHCLLWSENRDDIDQLVSGKTSVEKIINRLGKV